MSILRHSKALSRAAASPSACSAPKPMSRRLPWNVSQLGCRVEYSFQPQAASNGTLAHQGADRELDSFLHLYLLNRGVLITPFHNMVLISPATTAADVALHDRLFVEAVDELFPICAPVTPTT